MQNALLLQYSTLGLYLFFVGFCFCDGFKLHVIRKILWNILFLFNAIYVIKITGEFHLTLILPIPTILAILLCADEKLRSKAIKK